jgi:uncharacterized protein
MQSMTRDDLIQRCRAALQKAPPEVVAAYLYGSWARGEQGSGSDLDLAFWRDAPSESNFDAQPFRLAVRIEEELGIETDLVELNHAPADLIHEVLRDGIVILDRDPALRARLEVRARAEYLDILPALQRYRRAQAS